MVLESDAAPQWYRQGNWLPHFLDHGLSDPTLRVFGALVSGIRYRLRDWEVEGDTANRVTIKSLADRAHVSGKSVSRAFSKLIDAGLIDGQQAPDRVWFIHLLPPPRSRLTVLTRHAPQSCLSRLAVLTRSNMYARDGDLIDYYRNQEKQKNLVFSNLPSRGSRMEAEPPTIANIAPEDLTDTGRLLELHRQAVDAGWARASYLGPGGQLDFFAAAVHAKQIVHRDGGDACKLFAWIVCKRQWQVVTNANEEPAHERLREHLHPSLPRSTAPTLSGDARFVQHFLRVARNSCWYEKSDHLFAMLKDRLGDDWTQGRWDDACAELRDGGGPVHVGRVLDTLLARCGVTAPTIRIHYADSESEAPVRQAAG